MNTAQLVHATVKTATANLLRTAIANGDRARVRRLTAKMAEIEAYEKANPSIVA